MARSVECECTSNFTCGYCLRNAKPYFFTLESGARIYSVPADLCQPVADAEYNARLDAQRVTLEMRSKSPRRVDGGRLPMDESPLFGGRKQADLFGEDSGL